MPNIPPALVPPPPYRDMAIDNLSAIGGVREFLGACQNCGLPVDKEMADLQSHEDFAKAFLKNFYPDDAAQS